MKRETYAKKLKKLQAELVAVQEWAKNTGQRIVIVFEGRDAAGKGGIIKAMVTLPKPDDSDAYDDRKSLKGRRFIPEKF